jgi:hypothetical protein
MLVEKAYIIDALNRVEQSAKVLYLASFFTPVEYMELSVITTEIRKRLETDKRTIFKVQE